MSTPQEKYTLGEHVKINDEGKEVLYMCVRYVESSTLFEAPSLNEVYIEFEKYVELRNAEGQVKFVQLHSTKTIAKRAAGPIKGIKPYFWKGTQNGDQNVG